MAPLPDDSRPPHPSPDTFVTAQQEGAPAPPVLQIPHNLFPPLDEPEAGYMGAENPDEALNLTHVQEAADEVGETDSAASANECQDLNTAMQDSFWDRVQVLVKQEENADYVQPEVDLEGSKNIYDLTQGNDSLSYPKIPEDWKPSTKTELGQPPFLQVDNPGDWPEYCYGAKFAKKPKKYSHHALPTGARPVPPNEAGERKVEKWQFHYKGWDPETTADLAWDPCRHGASSKQPFPTERKGCLDYVLLKKLGVNKRAIVNCDPLLFYQLILPLGDPRKNKLLEGEVRDPRLPYYSEIERFTAKYAAGLGLGGSYSHSFGIPKIDELLKFDMILTRDGLLGGSRGSIHLRWDKDDSLYCERIATSMTHSRFLQLKRTLKLNDNDYDKNNEDPAKKFDLIFKTIVHNTNVLTGKADLDQCMDESTYGHAGYGPAGAGLMRRLVGKKVAKGGQVVLCSDVGRNRIRAYCHRHKKHEPYGIGWKREGICETRRIAEAINKMVLTDDDRPYEYAPKGIFTQKPSITADNYFGNDLVDDWMGSQGFGFMHTTRRDCLPAGVPDWAWHKESVLSTDKRTRVARFLHPITAVQEKNTNGQNPYTRVFCSFQSTGPTNISCINVLNKNQLFARTKARGIGTQKRHWVIEMNDARQHYLGTYGRVDTIDYFIKMCHIFYISWKYWHAAKNHGLCVALVTAYDFYSELISEPNARSFFGIQTGEAKKKLTFHQFRDRLALSGLRYDPGFNLYKGDELMRRNTRKSKAQKAAGSPLKKKATLLRTKRNRGRPSKEDEPLPHGVVTQEILTNAQKNRDLKKRFCGNLTKYIQHEESIKYLDNKVFKKGRQCYFCGEPSWSYCGICKDPVTQDPLMLHHCPRTGKSAGKCCFSHTHNDEGFGLAKKDQDYIGEKQKNWTPPNKKTRREHAKYIHELKIEVETNDLDVVEVDVVE
jgi:hypothetical protein